MLKTLAVSLLAAAALSLPSYAAEIDYNIDFSLSQYSVLLPTSGSFGYDPAVGFTNFIVNWDGESFDLTSAANNLTLTADPPTGCGPATGGYQYAFLLMTRTATGCDAHYAWGGTNAGFFGYDQFSFILNPGGDSTSQDVITQINSIPQAMVYDTASGSWTTAPELGALGMVLLGALALAGTRIRRAAAFRRR
jgi:hypothetical protein